MYFFITRLWRNAALILCGLLFCNGVQAAERSAAPAILAIDHLPSAPEARPSGFKPEIRSYAWGRKDKQTLIDQHRQFTTTARSLQKDDALLAQALPKTPVLVNSFPGNPHDDFDPPDPILAVGPAHVLSAVNYTVQIFNKAGQRQFSRSLRNWFASEPDLSGSFLFDPKVIYDQYDRHYIVMCLAFAPRAKRTFAFFSVSQTDNPIGQWAFWELDLQKNNGVKTDLYADFPGLGYDQQAIYITANMLDRAGNFKYAKIRILKKSEVYAFGPVSSRDFFNMTDATGSKAINVQPAQSFGDTPAEYLISTNAVSGNKLSLWTIKNGGTAPTLARRSITVPGYVFPPPALQKGGGAPINTGDAGVVNVVSRGGKLYTAQAVSHDWGTGNVAAMRFYQLRTNGFVEQDITFGQDGSFYYYPAVMTDSLGNVSIVFNRSGADEFAGIRFTGRMVTDPPGTLRNGTVLKNGMANYSDPVLDGLNPWGDYNGAALDPLDDSLWIFSEFVAGPSAWGTRIGHVKF